MVYACELGGRCLWWCIAIQLASSRCSLPSLLLNTTSLLSGKIKVKAKRLEGSCSTRPSCPPATRKPPAVGPRINLSDLNHIQTANPNTTLEAAGEGEELRQAAATYGRGVCGDGTLPLLRRCKPMRSSRR